ncbi:vitellogenin 3, phosvitinless [Gouania willdenowi]|uniref:vitellogenin 3, phosvitinless n=1 Tax=Gouania willdenowi TaxID=441366 RepID=UPI0010553094|nr:vitellogenin-like [Gouania willdenowi]
MRGLLLCCLVALATCQRGHYDLSFNPKKTYEYRYEGMVNFGLGAPNLVESGLKMMCKIKINGVSPQTFVLQISDLNFEEFNGLPKNDTFNSSAKLTQRIAAQLMKPFLFDYIRGHVSDIRASGDVSDTIVNIVRGVLDFLHFTVKTTQRVYELEEVGIHGMCHSQYATEENVDTKELTITQVVDVDNCREKAAQFKGMATAVPDKFSRQRGASVISTLRYVYSVKPTAEGGLITKAQGLERQHFSPFNVKGGNFKMQAKKELVLLSVTDTSRAITYGPMESRGNIVYKFFNSEAHVPIMMQDLQEPIPKAIELIRRLAQVNSYQIDSTTTEETIKLYQLLRMIPYEGLQTMWVEFSGNNELRRWFLDMIVEINDARVLKFLEARFKARDLSTNEALQTLLLVFDHLQALPELVENAKVFLDMPFTRSNVLLRQTVVLSYGSLVYKYCANYTTCPVPAVQPLLDLATESLRQSNAPDMVLALKALGNAGHPASIKTIIRFLPGVSATPVDLPPRVLSAAVQSMRLIAARDPHSVQDITLNLFLQKELPTEIRMLAFMILFESNPSMALVSTVTAHLLQEHDLHVASFAYTYLENVAKSKTPENYQISTAGSLALKLLAPKFGRLSYSYSRAGRMDWFDDNYLIGTAVEVLMLKSATSFFPTEMMTKSKFYVIGRILQLMEFGIRADGLKELFGTTIPGFNGDYSFNDFLAIFKSLQNWEVMPNDRPVISAYTRTSGQEWFFADVNKDLIRNIIMAVHPAEDSKSPLWAAVEGLQKGFSWHWTKPFLIFEARYFQATTLGLPLEISKYYQTVNGITVNAKATINPPLNGKLTQLLHSDISVESDGFIGFTKDFWVFYGINTELFQCGSEFKSKMPLSIPYKVTAKLNMREKKFELDIPALKKEIEILSVSSNVYAVTRNIEELALARLTPMIPDSFFTNDEIVTGVPPVARAEPGKVQNKWHPKSKLRVESNTYGVGVSIESELKRLYYHEEYPLYYFLGYTHMALKITPAQAGKSLDRIHFEINAGASKQPLSMHQMLATLKQMSQEAMKKLSSDPASAAGKVHGGPDSRHCSIYLISQGLSSTPEPVVGVKVYAMSSTQKPEGYDASVYHTAEAGAISAQLIVSQVADETNWKMCVDTSVDRQAVAKAHIRWGSECQSYEMSIITAPAVLPSMRPALTTKVHWPKIPDSLVDIGRRFESYIPGMALFLGFSEQQEKNASQEVSASIGASAADSIDVMIKLPEYTIYRQAIPFPVQSIIYREQNIRNSTTEEIGRA